MSLLSQNTKFSYSHNKAAKLLEFLSKFEAYINDGYISYKERFDVNREEFFSDLKHVIL